MCDEDENIFWLNVFQENKKLINFENLKEIKQLRKISKKLSENLQDKSLKTNCDTNL